MRYIKTAVLAATALTVALQGTARAEDEFERGFRTELGAVAARSAVGIVADGLFGGRLGGDRSLSTDQYIDRSYRVRFDDRTAYGASGRYDAPRHRPARYEDDRFERRPSSRSEPRVSRNSPASVTQSTLFRVAALENGLEAVRVENVAWEDLQEVLLRSGGLAGASIGSTEGVAFSDDTLFRVRSVRSGLDRIGVENVAWADLRKILARSMV